LKYWAFATIALTLKIIFIVLLFCSCHCSIGQVVNSRSADKTGMYFFAVDSLVRILGNKKEFNRIILRADRSVIQEFPIEIQNKTVVKDYDLGMKNRHINGKDVVLKINGVNVDHDEVTLALQAWEKNGKRLIFLAEALYIFHFKYRTDTQNYRLMHIRSGLVL
jgi:hypothetical protein